MSSGEGSNGYKEVETQGKSLDFTSRHNLETASSPKNLKEKDNVIHSDDPETMELYARARAQEKELRYLREQIALASVKESELLNEKYTLERKFSELRMALDEKQSEVVTSASNELARRKGDFEVNLNLLNELKAVEDEKHVFTTYLLGVLAEYGAFPHSINAYALVNSIKHLHDQLQLKIRTSHGGHGFSQYSHYDGKILDPVDGASRYVQHDDSKHIRNLTPGSEMRQLPNNENLLGTLPDIDRNVTGYIGNNMLERSGFLTGEQRGTDQFSPPSMMQDENGSFASEDEGPGIEGFQIIGDAKPGIKLLGCGFPVRGTSLCMFQWVRHYPDGTRQYIEGATNPDYLVTADDVDKIIAVECIPMDDLGRQGDLVRLFANDQNKITCDKDMQEEIDAYVSNGSATFAVLIALDPPENWEQATLILGRSGFQVNVQRKQEVVISEKYSKDLSVKIPSGHSGQFVLTCSNGSSYPFRTSNDDIRMRDTIVLTIRILQAKALDDKRKVKA